MALSTEQLKIILISSNLIDPVKFDEAQKNANAKKIPIEQFLPENGLIQDDHLGLIIANYMNVDFIDLSKEKIDILALKQITEDVARHQQLVAFKQDDKSLYVATTNPKNFNEISLIKKKTGKDVKVYYATQLGIIDALKNYKTEIQTRADKLLKSLIAQSSGSVTSMVAEDAIIKLVDVFIEYASDSRASDIHIEPYKKEVSLRFRIDGDLQEILRYPKEYHDNVVSRIKIMSKLSIDEHDAAQDGRFSFTKGVEDFDIRVSILPTTNGENVVMRILLGNSKRLFISDLGLDKSDFEKITRASLKPYGMILAVGPTGSGKTTTLYSILHELNKPDVNIMTIEDPVEYEIEEIRQTQVNLKKKITFADGLRSIVRQDPDIIMVGEIRDEETANIAVNSAMTGHLVLSTLHSNDAATSFPRLMEMKVEPFLVASSINVIMSQRLIRKICVKCRESFLLDKTIDSILVHEPKLKELVQEISGKEDISLARIYHGKGCNACNETGYAGRTGIFEVLELNDEIKGLISQKATATEIYNKAEETGMTSMLHDGIRKVLQGVTTLEEVIRATKT